MASWSAPSPGRGPSAYANPRAVKTHASRSAIPIGLLHETRVGSLADGPDARAARASRAE